RRDHGVGGGRHRGRLGAGPRARRDDHEVPPHRGGLRRLKCATHLPPRTRPAPRARHRSRPLPRPVEPAPRRPRHRNRPRQTGQKGHHTMTLTFGEVTRHGDRFTLDFERILDTDIDDAWSAVTQPERPARWMAPYTGAFTLG